MNYRILFGVIALVILVSGCLFDSDDNGTKNDKKGSVSGTVKMTVTAEPVAGMKVYLVNMRATVDTVNYSSNRKAFVDSAMTDAGGKYSITGIASGDYGVFPVNEDTTAVYKFSSAAGSDSSAFSMNGDARTVNFIAEKIDFPGANSDMIEDSVRFTNNNIKKIVQWRRYWCAFVPFLLDYYEINYSIEKNWFVNTYSPGYTFLLGTEDNCYFYEVTLDDGKTVKFSIYHALGAECKEYKYNFDHTTDTLIPAD